jgi:hypothetical protein
VTTEPRHGDDLRIRCRVSRRLAAYRSLLAQSEIGSVIVAIANVLGHQPSEMAFIEHDHMVKQISTTRTDKAFCHAILPGALDAGSFGFYSKAPDRLNNAVIKVTAAVED